MGAYWRGGLICKNEFLGGDLFEGRAYSKLGAYSRIYGIFFINIFVMFYIVLAWQLLNAFHSSWNQNQGSTLIL